MKKPFAILCSIILLCSCSFAAADNGIPPLTNIVMKYNATANTLGTKQIDEKNLIVENNVNVFPAGTCLVAILMDENGNVTNGGVQMLPDSDQGEFLMTCLTMVTFLGEMNFEAYGKILYQFSQVLKGEEKGTVGMVGIDSFNMTKQDSGIQLLYYNYDLSCWF